MFSILALSCSGKFGKAGDNAAQYVREKMPETMKDVENVEAIEEGTGYLYNIDSCLYTIIDNESARKVGALHGASNLSIHGPNEFLEEARKAGLTDKRKTFMVSITYKSSKKDSVIVIMERDGITPAMTLNEYNDIQKELEERLYQYTEVDMDKLIDEIITPQEN